MNQHCKLHHHRLHILDFNPLNTRLLCYCTVSETRLFYDVIVISCDQTRRSPGLVSKWTPKSRRSPGLVTNGLISQPLGQNFRTLPPVKPIYGVSSIFHFPTIFSHIPQTSMLVYRVIMGFHYHVA